MVVFYAMARFGFATDSEYEGPLKADLQKLTDDAEKAIYDEAGKLFNINSGKQLYEVLMGLGVNRGWIPTTYAIGIYDQKDAETRVHGNINQTEATTGRMSITKPALQTLPKKDKRIRRAFMPPEDFELWFMDLDLDILGPSKTSLIAGTPLWSISSQAA